MNLPLILALCSLALTHPDECPKFMKACVAVVEGVGPKSKLPVRKARSDDYYQCWFSWIAEEQGE